MQTCEGMGGCRCVGTRMDADVWGHERIQIFMTWEYTDVSDKSDRKKARK